MLPHDRRASSARRFKRAGVAARPEAMSGMSEPVGSKDVMLYDQASTQ
jgi:hypothetical protein